MHTIQSVPPSRPNPVRPRRRLLSTAVAAVIGLGMAAALAPAAVAATASASPASTSRIATVQPAATAAVLTKVVNYATAIEHGTAETGWKGGYVQYVWGGGHKAFPGPSTGTCVGDPDSLSCTDPSAVGTDCSGFARWVYDLAYGSDVLGSGPTGSEIARMHKMSTAQAGDLVFFRTDTTHTHHVGVYLGGGKMINSYKTGTNVQTNAVSDVSGLLGYYQYN